VTVDYESLDSLREALTGQDAVVSALGKASGLALQFKLVDAASDMGVKRFLPSEFGADLQNATIRTFPTYRAKVELERYIEAKVAAGAGTLTYTYVYNSMLLEDALVFGALGDLRARKVNIFDGGATSFAATRRATVGRAVVSVLERFDQTANRAIRVRDILITPQRVLEILREIGPEQEWTPVPIDTEKGIKDAKADLASGNFNPKAFAAFAMRATFAAGHANAESYGADNEILGIQELSEAQFGQILVQASNGSSS
jgi:hypothetical protein